MARKESNKTINARMHKMVVVTGKVTEYVNQFNLFANKSAEAVLEMCRVVYEAERNLMKGEFTAFAQSINLKTASASISKWKTIGAAYARLIAHKEHLPPAWTTLYNLARLDDGKLLKGIDEMVICDTLSNNDLRKFAPEVFPNKSRSEKVIEAEVREIAEDMIFSIRSSVQLTETKVKELMALLQPVCEDFEVELVAEVGE